MTNKQMILRRNLLARIHQHGFTKEAKNNEAWKSFLMSSYKTDSAAKLSIDELYNLLDVLNKGVAPIISGIRPKQNQQMITCKQEMYINKLWADRGLKGLSDFCQRTINKRPLHLKILTKQEATKLIVGLEKMIGIAK